MKTETKRTLTFPICFNPQMNTPIVAIEYKYKLICANVPGAPSTIANIPYTPATLFNKAKRVMMVTPSEVQGLFRE